MTVFTHSPFTGRGSELHLQTTVRSTLNEHHVRIIIIPHTSLTYVTRIQYILKSEIVLLTVDPSSCLLLGANVSAGNISTCILAVPR